MVKVTVCIGSSCHLKGSRQVVEELQYLIKENNVGDDVNLSGAFCMGRCQENGVNVTVDGQHFSITPDEVKDFFKKEVLSKIK